MHPTVREQIPIVLISSIRASRNARSHTIKENTLKKIFIILLTTLIFTSSVLADGAVGVRIGVIDTGVSFKAINPDSVFSGKNYIFPEESLEDKIGHGTAVSAIIVGSVPARIEGICPTAVIIPLVCITKDNEEKIINGDTSVTAKAIYDAVDKFECKIINISSGAAKGSDELEKAVEYAESKGVLIITSAGNNQEDTYGAILYPAGYESVICVGAAEKNGSVAAFSRQNNTVDIIAPGTDLRLASINGTRIRGEGTSYATAVISGVAAQLMVENPELTAYEIRDILFESAININGQKFIYPDVTLGKVSKFFTDVHGAEHWAEKSVDMVVRLGIMKGTGENIFSPDLSVTRAMLVTVLYRAEGEPAANRSIPFADIDMGSWYADAVAWAEQNGIVKGISETEYAPDMNVTREQLATIMFRYAQFKGMDVVTTEENLGFNDVSDISEWAVAAMNWGVGRDYIFSRTKGEIAPRVSAARAEIAAFIHRYIVDTAK